MKYNIGDKVWLKETSYSKEGIYIIDRLINNEQYIDKFLIHHLPCEVEKKDKIERLEYEVLSEDRKVGINIGVHYFDADILSYASHSGKESGNNTIYTVITHKNKILVDKLNEIIEYINKEE